MNNILAFGILLLGVGFYWRWCNDGWSVFTPMMVAGDPFLDLMMLCWKALPWATMIIGIILLLVSARSTRQ